MGHAKSHLFPVGEISNAHGLRNVLGELRRRARTAGCAPTVEFATTNAAANSDFGDGHATPAFIAVDLDRARLILVQEVIAKPKLPVVVAAPTKQAAPVDTAGMPGSWGYCLPAG